MANRPVILQQAQLSELLLAVPQALSLVSIWTNSRRNEEGCGGAKIERVGEGIKVTFDSGILFKTGSSTLEQTAKTNIQGMAKVLNNYPDTNILIEGHTDSDGTDDFNLKLSERRAKAVADYAASIGVKASRITTVGRGESVPVASNDTAAGKQQNRRVEVAIMANEELKKKAEMENFNN